MFINLPNQVRLFYEKVGEGPNLIMLHGNGEDHTIFDALIKKLSPYFTIYAIDTRCHGQSKNVPFNNYETLANDIDLFIQSLELKKVSILGFSDGAIIATLLGIEQKNYLNKIISLGVTLNPHDIYDVWKKWIEREYKKTKDPLFKLMMEEPNISLDDLKLIKVPVLLFAADNDVMSLKHYRDIEENIPNSKLIIIENADHLSYIVHNDFIADDVIRFLNYE